MAHKDVAGQEMQFGRDVKEGMGLLSKWREDFGAAEFFIKTLFQRVYLLCFQAPIVSCSFFRPLFHMLVLVSARRRTLLVPFSSVPINGPSLYGAHLPSLDGSTSEREPLDQGRLES